ncbi:hypothetical protein F4778DRAFT_111556 [Xylariomycetidae sp. FL2044]|nr:hypothetical protein F4778DRAFT_111556 [Xylariomycetidae sp. FL2044]
MASYQNPGNSSHDRGGGSSGSGRPRETGRRPAKAQQQPQQHPHPLQQYPPRKDPAPYMNRELPAPPLPPPPRPSSGSSSVYDSDDETARQPAPSHQRPSVGKLGGAYCRDTIIDAALSQIPTRPPAIMTSNLPPTRKTQDIISPQPRRPEHKILTEEYVVSPIMTPPSGNFSYAHHIVSPLDSSDGSVYDFDDTVSEPDRTSPWNRDQDRDGISSHEQQPPRPRSSNLNAPPQQQRPSAGSQPDDRLRSKAQKVKSRRSDPGSPRTARPPETGGPSGINPTVATQRNTTSRDHNNNNNSNNGCQSAPRHAAAPPPNPHGTTGRTGTASGSSSGNRNRSASTTPSVTFAVQRTDGFASRPAAQHHNGGKKTHHHAAAPPPPRLHIREGPAASDHVKTPYPDPDEPDASTGPAGASQPQPQPQPHHRSAFDHDDHDDHDDAAAKPRVKKQTRRVSSFGLGKGLQNIARPSSSSSSSSSPQLQLHQQQNKSNQNFSNMTSVQRADTAKIGTSTSGGGGGGGSSSTRDSPVPKVRDLLSKAKHGLGIGSEEERKEKWKQEMKQQIHVKKGP